MGAAALIQAQPAPWQSQGGVASSCWQRQGADTGASQQVPPLYQEEAGSGGSGEVCRHSGAGFPKALCPDRGHMGTPSLALQNWIHLARHPQIPRKILPGGGAWGSISCGADLSCAGTTMWLQGGVFLL